jgi:hypothetical protein
LVLTAKGPRPYVSCRFTRDHGHDTEDPIPAVLWGVAFGNVLHGIPLNAAHNYTGNFFSLLNPNSLLGGVTTLSLFTLNGALFLGLKTTDDLRRASASGEHLRQDLRDLAGDGGGHVRGGGHLRRGRAAGGGELVSQHEEGSGDTGQLRFELHGLPACPVHVQFGLVGDQGHPLEPRLRFAELNVERLQAKLHRQQVLLQHYSLRYAEPRIDLPSH